MELFMLERIPKIHSKRLFNELYAFVWIGQKAQANQGSNDDLVMAFAIGIWVRDTAIRLRGTSLEMSRQLVDSIVVTHNTNQYTDNRRLKVYNPYLLNTGKGTEDFSRWMF
jgi:hypothetical protein